MATGHIVLYDFYLHVIGNVLCRTHCDAAATHNHNVPDVFIRIFSSYLAYVGYVFLGGHEVNQVETFDAIVSARYNGFVAAFNGYYMVRGIRTS